MQLFFLFNVQGSQIQQTFEVKKKKKKKNK